MMGAGRSLKEIANLEHLHIPVDTAPETPVQNEVCLYADADGHLKQMDWDGVVTDLAAVGGSSPAWSDITGKPTTFTPSTHGHPFSEITGVLADNQIPSNIARDNELPDLGAHTTAYDHTKLHDRQHSITSTGDHTFPGGTTNFLRADGTWATPPVGGGGGLPAESSVVLLLNHSNATTTALAITGLAATLGVGTWLIKYWLVYQTAATTTGIQMYLDHTGTTSRLAGTWYQLTTGGAAATGIGDQATTATAQMLEGKAQRADNVASGPTQGVDTANADQFAVYEALAVVTVSGTLNLMMNTEVAASAATIMAGSTLMLTQVA